jgi:hypothetical protein
MQPSNRHVALAGVGIGAALTILSLAASPALAQEKATNEFAALSPPPAANCPTGSMDPNQIAPNCAAVLIVNKAGNSVWCACSGNGVSAPPQPTIDPSLWVLELQTAFPIVKIDDTATGQDPCIWYTINGVKKYICY